MRPTCPTRQRQSPTTTAPFRCCEARESTVDIRQKDHALAVKINGQPLTGALKGDVFELRGHFYSSEAGETALLRIDGKVEGDRLA